MGQVTVTVNGRTYRLECGDGEEKHLIALSEYIGSHVDQMRDKFGQVGDDRLILMAALLITDEVWDLRRQNAALKAEQARLREGRAADDRKAHMARTDIADAMDQAAKRLEALRAQFESGADAPKAGAPKGKR
jgi:cell division protein ZapA